MPYLDVGACRIHYQVTGAGEPVVLIMGLGMDMTGWDRLMPHLKAYRVLRIDNRGSGLSEAPDVPYTIGAMASDVVAAMRAAGMSSAHVYGASLGSMIAQQLTLSHPELVRSMILGCPSPGAISVPGDPGILRLLLARRRYTPAEAFWRAAPFLFHDALNDPAALKEALRRRAAMPFNPVGYRRQLEAALRWSSLTRLHRVRVPTLVIHGDHDRLIPSVNGRLVARLIPGAQLHIVKGAGHVYSVDAPEEAARTALAFLEAHSETAGPASPRRRTGT